jgi:hypothetical protein
MEVYLGLGFRVWGIGFRDQGSGFRVSGLRVEGVWFRVQGSGFRVQSSGFRVYGPPHALSKPSVPKYSGTSLIRNCLFLGPYSRAMPRALRWS